MPMNNYSIWVIDDDDSIRWVLERALQKANYRVTCFADARDVRLALAHESPPHAIISDIRMPGESGVEFLQDFRNRHAGVPVIIVTAHSDLDSAVSAYRSGAFEYLPKPFDIDELIDATARACEWHDAQLDPVFEDRPVPQPATELIGEAPAMQSVFRAIGRLARSNMTVLISGESGSGKELIARALHRHSPRADQIFIALNVAAIPHDLMESELFGHEKGAFTGAHAMRRGRFEQAHGGTLFLDEIGDMSIDLQTRLLRVLADGQFYRVGGHTPVSVDVRIITATHRDLEAHVAEQKFREDLFHRLNVIRINVPALRERREDIPALLAHFLTQAASELDTETKRASDEMIVHLQSLNWPGNVRELENLCRWMTVMAAGEKIGIGDLPKGLAPATDVGAPGWESALKAWALTTMASGEPNLLAKALPIFERTLIECAMQKARNNRQDAATLIGWGRNTLTRKIKQLGID
jgi:two-component system nitrogen regulation response regulator GlnG